MKECLHCHKYFEPKKPTRKFCSDSCRVMHHRKHGKKDSITSPQIQVLYNAILDLIDSKKLELPSDYAHIEKIGILKPSGLIEPINFQVPKIRRSFDYYRQSRIDCQTQDEWNELKEEILSSDLSQKQKILLTT